MLRTISTLSDAANAAAGGAAELPAAAAAAAAGMCHRRLSRALKLLAHPAGRLSQTPYMRPQCLHAHGSRCQSPFNHHAVPQCEGAIVPFNVDVPCSRWYRVQARPDRQRVGGGAAAVGEAGRAARICRCRAWRRRGQQAGAWGGVQTILAGARTSQTILAGATGVRVRGTVREGVWVRVRGMVQFF